MTLKPFLLSINSDLFCGSVQSLLHVLLPDPGTIMPVRNVISAQFFYSQQSVGSLVQRYIICHQPEWSVPMDVVNHTCGCEQQLMGMAPAVCARKRVHLHMKSMQRCLAHCFHR